MSAETIRVFIGTEIKTTVAFRVLAHSIRRRTKHPVEITPMLGHKRWEYSTEGFKQGTGFSLRRWLIPEACDWEGYAIYLDADQIVLGDIADLWRMPFTHPNPSAGEPAVWCTYQPDKFRKEPWPQSSVMLISCRAAVQSGFGWRREAMLKHLRKHPTREAYANFMHGTWMSPPPARIPTAWNHLNVYKPGETKLLHYTREPDQAWYKPEHPLASLWQKELVSAIKAGELPRAEFTGALAKWNVKEDWRSTNGLHPHYRKYLSLFGA